MRWECYSAFDPEVLEVHVKIPQPIIIYNDWSFEQWEEFFRWKLRKTNHKEEIDSYTACLKIFLFAELCDGRLTHIFNVETIRSGSLLALKFRFSNIDCRNAFYEGFRSHWRGDMSHPSLLDTVILKH